MEVFDQYSALLALGMPPCLPKPHDADAEAPAGWHWSGLADLSSEVARLTLEGFALDWFVREFGMCSLTRQAGRIQLHSIRREGTRPQPRKPIRRRLGQLLLEQGLLDEDSLEHALKIHRQTGKRLGQVLLDTNILTAHQLIPTLALQLGVECMTPEELRRAVTPEAAFTIPERECRRFNLICVGNEGATMRVAMSDPADVIVLDTLRTLHNRAINPILADRVSITDAIDGCFAVHPRELLAVPVVRYVDATLREMIKQGATAARFRPGSDGVVAEFEFDELIGDVTAPPKRLYHAVLARLKQIGGVEPERPAPVQSRAEYKLGEDLVDVSIEVSAGDHGEVCLLHIRALGAARNAPAQRRPLMPVTAEGETLLDAIIEAARKLSGEGDEGTGIHAKVQG